MPNKLLRSPQNITSTGGSGAVESARLIIEIDDVVRYTLVKPSIGTAAVVFEVGELCRDYLNLTFNGTYAQSIAGLKLEFILTFWDGVNATGNIVNTYQPAAQYGYDGYGIFVEGNSPNLPNNATCISNYTQTSGGTKTYTIFAPLSYGGRIPSLNSTGTAIFYESFSTSGTTKQLQNGQVVNIKRYECSKYDDGLQIFFVNKYGAIQEEWFTLKNVEAIKSRREQYNRNIISSTGSYDINTHTRQDFNVNALQEFILNSDFMPDYYNTVYTELLQSEQVWIRMKNFYTNTLITTPVNITTNDLVYKTSLNDRLVQFTFAFNLSADYINNIR